MQINTVQYWYVFAFDLTDNTPKTGDAAQITADVYIDDAVANAVDDTNPTELAHGFYRFDITAAESNGDQILIDPVSATADIQVVGVPGAVSTVPASFNTSVALTGDSYARLGAPVGASISADIVGVVAAMIAGIADGAYDLQDLIRLIAAACAGKSSGGGTNTLVYRDLSDTVDRIEALVDSNGNRLTMTYL